MRTSARFALSMTAVAWMSACGVRAHTPERDGGERACVPGESRACACPSGATGAQVCERDRPGFGECQCAGGTVGGADDGGLAPDGAVEDDGGTPPRDGGACTAPTTEYGTSEGSTVTPFTLPRCDDTPFELYGAADGFCDAAFTVVIFTAGWCAPCRAEAARMQEELVEAYADRGVRFVVVILHDDAYSAPDAAFCQAWTDQYGLTNAVLYDVAQSTSVYIPGGALPANLILDSTGVIRHRQYGVSETIETLRAELDDLLGSP